MKKLRKPIAYRLGQALSLASPWIIYGLLFQACLVFLVLPARGDAFKAMQYLNQKWVNEPAQHQRQLQIMNMQNQQQKRAPAGNSYYNSYQQPQRRCYRTLRQNAFTGQSYFTVQCY